MAPLKQYLIQLVEALKTFDKTGAVAVVEELIAWLTYTNEPFDVDDAETIMQQLRSKRMFVSMMKVGDALIQTGKESFKIRKLYGQSLVDQNIFTAATAILSGLIHDAEKVSHVDANAKSEANEAKGLLGRIFKQLYINRVHDSIEKKTYNLKGAIDHYLEVYNSESQTYTWHGINVVALLHSAKRNGIDTYSYPDFTSIAKTILDTIATRFYKQEALAWDLAVAAEACVALGRTKEAVEWFSVYARMPLVNAFELAGTLRQLETVWNLNMNSAAGSLILPLLRSELLKREGGTLTISFDELQKQKSSEIATTEVYNSLAVKTPDQSGLRLEKVFGDDSFKTYKWYMRGASRCLPVARIGRDSSKGAGTGFLLKGQELHHNLNDELVLVTNAHVVSDDPHEKGLRPHEAVIIFEALDRDEEFKVGEILFTSSSWELDATIIRFTPLDQQRLQKLTSGIDHYPVAKTLPLPASNGVAERVYVIGHPYGGTLQLSFQDNILLDCEDPRLHYRTPTEGGSSGSPVFNQQWELIGLHHAGSVEMSCLNGKPGTYNANEGIAIQTIRRKFAEKDW
ncbi:serine protease [Segetibacter sp. 3557_3]|uniref:serine protease n=1 Tax=Segetibacter sp. 3557_3 TaxID=2547429 RepID=UPI001058C15D|nr:serine protease [Segetibacter sp. 3557_3]TDH28695.1 serine protease [Segetibacter sp. 3557_3]